MGDEFAGEINLSIVQRGPFQSSYVGYWIDEAQAGHGYTPEALVCVCRTAFEDLHLHRVQISIIPRNTASRRVVEKLEIREEGTAVRYLEINGVWEDHIRYAMTAEEWDDPRQGPHPRLAGVARATSLVIFGLEGGDALAEGGLTDRPHLRHELAVDRGLARRRRAAMSAMVALTLPTSSCGAAAARLGHRLGGGEQLVVGEAAPHEPGPLGGGAVEHLAEQHGGGHGLRAGDASEHPGVAAARVQAELQEAGVEAGRAARRGARRTPGPGSCRRRRRHR